MPSVGDSGNLGNVKPILLSMTDKGYWKLGDRIANALEVGKNSAFIYGGYALFRALE